MNRKSLKRDIFADSITKDYRHDDQIYLQPWKRYYFSIPINHGLARVTEVFPANVTVILRFHRAPSNFSLLKINDNISMKLKSNPETVLEIPFNYEESVIPFINPILNTYYAYSQELEQIMSKHKLYNYEIDFMDYVVRRTVLESGLSDYSINITNSKMPKFIIFAFSTLDRLSGSQNLSLTKFQQENMCKFDLILDHESLPGYPMAGHQNSAIDFYQNYLKQTNR